MIFHLIFVLKGFYFFFSSALLKSIIYSPELTRLWSLSSDNLAACQNKSREFIPSLQDYFIECVEQNDPKNAIEEQYK